MSRVTAPPCFGSQDRGESGVQPVGMNPWSRTDEVISTKLRRGGDFFAGVISDRARD